jgi:hypothetical protein
MRDPVIYSQNPVLETPNCPRCNRGIAHDVCSVVRLFEGKWQIDYIARLEQDDLELYRLTLGHGLN